MKKYYSKKALYCSTTDGKLRRTPWIAATAICYLYCSYGCASQMERTYQTPEFENTHILLKETVHY
jgi:hypothetical protein